MERPLDRTVLTAAVLAGTVATAWAVTASAPEPIDLRPAPFLASWTAMMAAMMLPAALGSGYLFDHAGE